MSTQKQTSFNVLFFLLLDFMTDIGFIAPVDSPVDLADLNAGRVDLEAQPRYALYFAPVHDNHWWKAGSHWLGRDAATDLCYPQPSVDNVPNAVLHRLTKDARRYGFHATLKAPFRLAKGFSEKHLIAMAHSFSRTQPAIEMNDIGVHFLGEFLALQTTDRISQEKINALATRCVSYFDLLRAQPNEAELIKRKRYPLSARQEVLLAKWGYQYTEEEYRFHLTLTDTLASEHKKVAEAICDVAIKCFSTSDQATRPFVIDGLTIFKESFPGAPMIVWKHFPFSACGVAVHNLEPDLPPEGRLFFVVGPSGVGKDALLQWVQKQLPEDTNLIFCRRSVTRPAHASEEHQVMTSAQFSQAEQEDAFSMTWQANGTRYGITRGIEAELKAGKDVVVNGSREYVPQLRRLFPRAKVIWIVANPDLIRTRIENRQRESGLALENRLLRSTAFDAREDDNITYIDNSGPIDIAGGLLATIFSDNP